MATEDGEYRLVTAAEIDREVSSEFQLQIHCSDFGDPPLNTTKYLTIIIKDLNDNSPKFAQEIYNISIAENSEVKQEIIRVEANDPDDRDNGKIYYALQSEVDSVFEIDKSSGSIWTTLSLDREKKNFHTLQVIAKDGGQPNSKISTATVVVTVVDTNDEVPYFLRSDYVFSLYENQPPKTVIGQVKAKDRDLFPYNRHSFYVDESKSNFPIGLFKIDSRTGVIITKQYLNREEREMYNMTVAVKDDENPTFQTTTEIIIKVLDVNDNPPLLLFPVPGNESIYAPVTAPKGYYLGKIRAYDPDSEENARLIFIFEEEEDLASFDLNSQTGDITVRSDLSKLDSQLVQIIVLVEDSGIPKKSISANLRIHIVYNSLLTHYPPTSSTVDTQQIILIAFVSGTLILAFALTIVSCYVCHHRRNATKELHLTSSCGVIAHDNRKPICLHGVGEIIGETDTECDSDKSWKRASATAEDEAFESNLDGYVVNKNLMNDTASQATTFDRRSANSDMMSQCQYNDVRVVAGENGMGQMYLPQLMDFNSCCKYISYRPTCCISDSNGEFPVFPCRSPVWKLPHPVHQRLPSCSNWLNSESFQLQRQGHTHNVNHMNHATDNGPITHNP